MILSQELDPFLKLLAEMFATVGYTSFHCYFMAKDMMIDSINTISDHMDKSQENIYLHQIVFFNFIWMQTSILNNFRAFQIITAQKIFYANLEPTNELQKNVF